MVQFHNAPGTECYSKTRFAKLKYSRFLDLSEGNDIIYRVHVWIQTVMKKGRVAMETGEVLVQ